MKYNPFVISVNHPDKKKLKMAVLYDSAKLSSKRTEKICDKFLMELFEEDGFDYIIENDIPLKDREELHNSKLKKNVSSYRLFMKSFKENNYDYVAYINDKYKFITLINNKLFAIFYKYFNKRKETLLYKKIEIISDKEPDEDLPEFLKIKNLYIHVNDCELEKAMMIMKKKKEKNGAGESNKSEQKLKDKDLNKDEAEHK